MTGPIAEHLLATPQTLARRRLLSRAFKGLCMALTWLCLVLLAVLVFHATRQGIAWLDLQFLREFPSRFPERAGIKSALYGTLWLISLTALFSIPIGVAAAIYLEEYAKPTRLNTIVEISIANLAGVPSVVYGILGLAVFVRWFALGPSVVAGALTMSLLILPIIIVASREALRAVPDSIRRGAFALGATRWQTVRHHVLPSALPGVLTGTILALSRAVGETAPLILVGAAAFVAFVRTGGGGHRRVAYRAVAHECHSDSHSEPSAARSMTDPPVPPTDLGAASDASSDGEPILETRDLVIRYGDKPAIKGVNLAVPERKITAIIGPSGCGKSTLLRQFNRMNDFVRVANMDGTVLYRGVNLYDETVDPVEVRRRIGMVFQKPNPFPKTIFKNVSWGPVINGFKGDLNELVESSLQRAALWDEVKDRLNESALALSGGQQQRLCIARALALHPEIILMDEPASALDPVSTARIEDLMFELRKRYTIVIVTHNMQQAARVSNFTAFLDAGKLIEFGETDQVFTRPNEKRTEDYVSGRFG